MVLTVVGTTVTFAGGGGRGNEATTLFKEVPCPKIIEKYVLGYYKQG